MANDWESKWETLLEERGYLADYKYLLAEIQGLTAKTSIETQTNGLVTDTIILARSCHNRQDTEGVNRVINRLMHTLFLNTVMLQTSIVLKERIKSDKKCIFTSVRVPDKNTGHWTFDFKYRTSMTPVNNVSGKFSFDVYQDKNIDNTWRMNTYKAYDQQPLKYRLKLKMFMHRLLEDWFYILKIL